MTEGKKHKRPRPARDVQEAQRALVEVQHRYLRSHGWSYTSSTPGCLWMWTKRCEMQVSRAAPTSDKDRATGFEPCWIMVDTDTAIAMQRSSCAVRGDVW